MYRATDVRLGRKVALKVIGEHITGDAEFRERFVDEARNTAAIDHANIVPLYDFGELDGLLYLAMRLVHGSDLAKLIADGPLSPHRALELLDQAADALDVLHEHGLVHLDLKPANVLVTTRESAGEHVYLADFGLTRRGATGHRTSGGDFLGSPTYAAPEHLRGEPVDGRTDLYALACVLFACLTGRPPFQGQVPEVIHGHLNMAPPAATSMVALPAAIDEVLVKGMAKRPSQRYSTCHELISAARVALESGARMDIPAPPRAQQGPGQQMPGQQGHGGSPFRAPQPVPSPAPPPLPQYRQAPFPPATIPPATMPPGQPAQQHVPPRSGQPQQTQQPVRLGPAVPVRPRVTGTARWLVPLLVALAMIVLTMVFIATVGPGGTRRNSMGSTRPSAATLAGMSSGPSGTPSSGAELPTPMPTLSG